MPENKNNTGDVKKVVMKQGVVTSDKMNKTIVVRIDRIVRHSFYGKVLTRSTKLKAHDEKNIAKEGDIVTIVQVRPLSKCKRWKLGSIVQKKRLVKT